MEVIKIKLSFSNAYLVKGHKSILVDAGAPNQADEIISAVKRAGVNEKDISLIVQTHGHFDHAGSTAALKRKLGIPVAVHPKDAFMLQQGINGEIKPINFEARIVAAVVPNSFEPSEPDILIEKEMDLNDFGVDARVVFTPGHTKGSVSVLCGNHEAIIGDLMMGGWLGGALRGFQPNYHYFIDDIHDVHTSMKKILTLNPSKLYVGHGGPLKLQDVVRQFENKISFQSLHEKGQIK